MNSKSEILKMVQCGELSPKEGTLRIKQLFSKIKYYMEDWIEERIEDGTENSCKIIFFCDPQMKQLFETEFSGNEFIFITKGNQYRRISETEYCINHKQESDYKTVFQNILTDNKKPDAIVHLWSLNTSDDEDLEDSGYSILNIGKQILNFTLKKNIQIIYCYKEEENRSNAAQKAVYSIFKSLEEETSMLVGKSISFETQDMNVILKILKQELGRKVAAQIRYQEGKRFVKTFQLLNAQERIACVKSNGTYLIAGGAGGLGNILTTILLEKGANVICCGRSAEKQVPDGVTYFTCDTSILEEVTQIKKQLKSRGINLNGIFICTGIANDSLLKDKDLQYSRSVIQTKVQTVQNLDQEFAEEDLDFFVMYSSLAAFIPSMGQSDYAYANGYLSAYAAYRTRMQKNGKRSGRTLSIAWPFFLNGGMKMEQANQELMERTKGLIPLEGQRQYELIEELYGLKQDAVIVINGDSDVLLKQKSAENMGTENLVFDKAAIVDAVMKVLKEKAAGVLHEENSTFQENGKFSGYGFDSITSIEFINAINYHYKVKLLPSILFEYTKFSTLANFLVANYKQEMLSRCELPKSCLPETIRKKVNSETEESQDIAIVGIGGKFPKSKNIYEFWNHLKNQDNLITEIPEERWKWEDYWDEDTLGKNKTTVIWGGFIDGVDKFDEKLFGITPNEANYMNPQQRLLLESIWTTLENAGHSPSSLRGSNTGVFVGIAGTEYSDICLKNDVEISAYSSMGLAHSIAANRVSYLFDFHGPSEAIDTACSSSLVALNRAINAIQDKQCDAAIVSGVNVILTPTLYIAFDKAGMLSKTGKCSAFDKNADGFVRGEGVGTLYIKPLLKALEDKDYIYGIVKASGVNHGGDASSLTSPNTSAQKDLLEKIYKEANIDFDTVTYIETHGTGTVLGDSVEVNALRSVYQDACSSHINKNAKCGLGSVKTNIGHLETAAGVVSVIKVLLSMQNGVLPGNINFHQLSPMVDFENTPFYIVDKTMTWERQIDMNGCQIPRRAGVSSFGFGGSNAHVLLEEYRLSQRRSDSDNYLIVPLSAQTKDQLDKMVGNLADYLEEHTQVSIHDVAYTLQNGREEFQVRLAVCVKNRQELVTRWREYLNGEYKNIHFGICLNRSGVSSNSDHYESLCADWVNGGKIEWNTYFEGADVRRVPLPGYEFNANSHWVKTTALRKERNEKLICLKREWEEMDDVMIRPLEQKKIILLCDKQQDTKEAEQIKDCIFRVITTESIDTITCEADTYILDIRVEETEKQFFETVVKCCQSFVKANIPLNYVYAFDSKNQRLKMVAGALESFFQTLSMEYAAPDGSFFHYQLIGYENINRLKLIPECRNEYILHENGKCFKQVIREVPFLRNSTSGNSMIRNDGLYLVFGGAGGLGSVTVRYMLSETNSKIIVAGRSDTSNSVQELARQYDNRVTYMKCDISDISSVRNLKTQIEESYGTINGIIHSAGKNDDNSFRNKATEQFMNVLESKVIGCMNLDQVFEHDRLDFILLYSSVAAYYGSLGQTDYCLANRFMEEYAAYRNQKVKEGLCYGVTIDIAWPLWENIGMKMPEGVQKHLNHRYGMIPIGETQGIEILLSALQGDGKGYAYVYGENVKLPEHVKPGQKETVIQVENVPLQENVFQYIKGILCTLVGTEAINRDTTLEELCIDSILISQFTEMVQKDIGKIGKTILFECNNVDEVVNYMLENYGEQLSAKLQTAVASQPVEKAYEAAPAKNTVSRDDSEKREEDDDIAIIGFEGKFASANDVSELWEKLKAGADLICKVPKDRWDNGKYYSGNPEDSIDGKYYCQTAGFVNQADQFDALFFHISPKEAELMDPQERMLLETAWNTIEKAGYSKTIMQDKFDNEVGVFVGVTTHTYNLIGGEELFKGNPDIAKSESWSIANRISYFMNWKGPSLAVDTACSSSLTALHYACQSLKAQESQMAFVGGVNLYLHPAKFIYMSQMKMLSESGICSPFGEKADGFVPGEGVGGLLLKTRKQAEKDRDHIYGIIKATAVNHNGMTNGYTVPSVNEQAKVIKTALIKSGVNPETISYVEAHGTGTRLGDPIEIAGLTKAWNAFTKKKQFCAIGSVKANIGHGEACAGIASVVKVLLQMEHEQLVPSLHSEVSNDRIEFDHSPFYIQHELQDWAPKNSEGVVIPRRAAISSFGAGGLNVHVIMEEYKQTNDRCVNEGGGSDVFILSARNRKQLEAYAIDFLTYIKEHKIKTQSVTEINQSCLIGESETQKKLAQLLDVSVESINGHDSLEDYGLDLLMFQRFVQSLQIMYEQKLDFREMTIDWTLDQVNAYINKMTKENDMTESEPEYDISFQDFIYSSRLKEVFDERLVIEAHSINEIEMALDQFVQHNQNGSYLVYNVKQENLWEGKDCLNEKKTNWTKWEVIGRKLALPTYPFEHKSYWSPIIKEEKQLKLNAILDENSSTFAKQRYCKNMKPSEFYLRDHVVDGVETLPGVFYLQMAETASKLSLQSAKVLLKEITYLQPIKMDNRDEIVKIDLEPLEQGCSFQIYTDQGVHMQGKAVGVKEDQTPKQISFQSIQSRCHSQILREAFYHDFEKQGIHYGRTFQCVHSLSYGIDEILAEIILSEGSEPLEKYPLHPSILDGALQATAAFRKICNKVENETFIPFGMREVHICQPLKEHCFAYVHNMKLVSEMLICDIYLVDGEGNVLVELCELSFRILMANQNSREHVQIHYYVTQWKPAEIQFPIKAKQKILLFHNEEEISEELTQFFDIISVRAAHSYNKNSASEYRICQEKPEDYTRLLQDLQNDNIGSFQIIYAWADRYPEPLEKQYSEYVKCGIQSIFNLCKAVQMDPEERKVMIQVINRERDGMQNPFFTALSGFLKTVHLENERIKVKVISFAEQDNRIGRLLADEINCEDREMEVSYVDGLRQIKDIKEIQMQKLPAKGFERKNCVYLITGALGGLARLMIREICKLDNDAKFILTDILEPGAKSKEITDEIVEAGKEVLYMQADLTVKEDVQKVVKAGHERFQNIHSIIHAAGLIQDEIFRNKQFATLEKVMAPKVFGTLNLDFATKEEPLESFVLFSSLAALGNAGQCDYAFANEFLVQFGKMRNQQTGKGERSGKTLVMNWPLWSGGGMKTDKQTQELFEHFGMQPLDSDKGIQALHISMCNMYEQVIVTQGNEKLISKKLKSMFLRRGETKSKHQQCIINGDLVKRQFTAKVDKFMRDLLKIDEEIDLSEEISDYGFDSISITQLVNMINRFYGLDLLPTNVFEYNTIQEFINHIYASNEELIASVYEQEVEEKVMSQQEENTVEERDSIMNEDKILEKVWGSNSLEKEPIAIVGMSCVMPGADNVEEFWSNLINQKNVITEIPADRWNWRKLYGDSKQEADKTLVNKAGFIKNIAEFDEELFGISNREAAFMDPVQRIVLEQSYLALEDAGIKREVIKDSNTGVYIGLVSMEYYELATQNNKAIDPYLSTGNSRAVTANRLSYLYGLRGPSEVIDTACSSSIVAVERAIDDIRLGKCDMAIAGGVNEILSSQVHIAYSRTGMLSPDGICKTFDDSADGYGRGEGCAIMILKPLSKAVEAGDNIHTIILGSAINHTGHVNTLTTPNPAAQTEVIAKAVEEAQVPFQSIGYIETHGTGTKLGDPIEITGLKNAEEILNQDKLSHPCVLGSVKTNIGHLEGAAGIAGMIKAVNALKHNLIPANMHFTKQNQYIDFENTGFTIAVQNTVFPIEYDKNGNCYPRRAGISSFGFGGVNAHIILEEYENHYCDIDENEAMHVLTLSGRTGELLQSYKESIKLWIQEHKEQLLKNRGLWKSMTYTLQEAKEMQSYRMAIVFRTIEELMEQLSNPGQSAMNNRIYRGTVNTKDKSTVKLTPDMSSEEMAQAFVTVNHISWKDCYQNTQKKVSLPNRKLNKKIHWYQAMSISETVEDVVREYVMVPEELTCLKERFEKDMSELEDYCAMLIMREFTRRDIFVQLKEEYSISKLRGELHVTSKYERLFKGLFEVLSAQGYLSIQDDFATVTKRGMAPEVQGSVQCDDSFLKQHEGIQPHIHLLNHCMPHLMEIMNGSVMATDILFPNSNMELVKSVYANNPGADYYNLLVVKTVTAYIKEVRKKEPERTIRILEAGAGTGGTSKSVVEKIAELDSNISYTYTDMGNAFINYGKNAYGKIYKFMEFKLLNVEMDPVQQGYEPYSYDLIIGANVFHATKDLSNCMKNMKTLLKPSGWIIVNEITKIQAFLTLTFGLTTGWWLFEDEQIRLHGGPLLSLNNWDNLFTHLGFESVMGVDTMLSERTVPQEVVVARNSNGVVDQPASETNEKKTDQDKQPQKMEKSVTKDKDSEYLEQYIRMKVVESMAETLMVEPETIQITVPYTEYGVDSILGTECINTINKTLEISVDATELFNRTDIIELSSYILEQYYEELMQRDEIKVYIRQHETFLVQPDNGSADMEYLEQYIREKVVENMAATLMVEPETIDVTAPYAEYGVDSILGTDCMNAINKTLGVSVDTSELFNRTDINKLSCYIAQQYYDELMQRDEVKDFVTGYKLSALLEQYEADEIDLEDIINKVEIEYGKKRY